MAIRILDQSLRSPSSSNSSGVTFSPTQTRRFPLYDKAPNLNDDMIFYNNVLPFDPHRQPFNLSRDSERGTRRNLPFDLNTRYFQKHSLLKAVDKDPLTCWFASRAIKAGDFFAVDLLSVQTGARFTLAVAHSPILQTQLELSISFDGLQWLTYHSNQGRSVKPMGTLEGYLHTYLFDSSRFTAGFASFRYARFQARQESDHHFHVCEVKLIAPSISINDTMGDFQPLVT